MILIDIRFYFLLYYYLIALENMKKLSYIKNKIKNILKIILNLKQIINNPPPVYTKRLEGTRLHLGSGNINLQGWINIDAREDSHIHILEKDFKLETFADDSISEIYLCHVLEHFTMSEIEDLLEIFNKKLLLGGTLRISVPNFDSIIKIYQLSENNIEKIKPILLGGQDHIYNFHKSIFNKSNLSKILMKRNFGFITEWNTKEVFGKSIGDYSSQIIKIANKDVPISLNLAGQLIKK